MESEIVKNDAVIYRRPLANNCSIVDIGTVVTLNADDGSATVQFPTLNKMIRLPLEKLEKTISTFGVKAKVSPSPATRTMQELLAPSNSFSGVER